jgi:transcriptional regulator with XRE-family HTH domain
MYHIPAIAAACAAVGFLGAIWRRAARTHADNPPRVTSANSGCKNPRTVSMTESSGHKLRAERERRKISLESVAASTKISAQLLDGLERDDFSRWPSGIFRRSFIRAYAEAIGVDAESAVRDCLARCPDSSGTDASPAAAPALPPALRLTLAESWRPFAGGRLLAGTRQRWKAAAWDAAVLMTASGIVFIVLGRFWTALAISALCYYLGAILVMGNTVGVYLFGPRAHDVEAPAGEAHPQALAGFPRLVPRKRTARRDSGRRRPGILSVR